MTDKIVINFKLDNSQQARFSEYLQVIGERVPRAVDKPIVQKGGTYINLMTGGGALSFANVLSELHTVGYGLAKGYSISTTVTFVFVFGGGENEELVQIFEELCRESGWTAHQYVNEGGSVINADSPVDLAVKTERMRTKNLNYSAPQVSFQI